MKLWNNRCDDWCYVGYHERKACRRAKLIGNHKNVQRVRFWCGHVRMRGMKTSDNHLSDEEADRRARAAIRRSFEMPYKPQKELVGKVGRPVDRKRSPSKTAKKP